MKYTAAACVYYTMPQISGQVSQLLGKSGDSYLQILTVLLNCGWNSLLCNSCQCMLIGKPGETTVVSLIDIPY